jgi:hypothetical protein
MNCPQDGTQLQMTAREGVEIDYCPTCRGVWLDRGELDKIIDRSEAEHTSMHKSQIQDLRHDDDDNHRQERRYDHDDRKYDTRGHDRHKKKKEGFLGELFDF